MTTIGHGDEAVKNFWKNEVRELFRRAGETACRLQTRVQPRFKADRSVVTEADLQISRIFHEGLRNLSKEHFFVDEETLESQQCFDQKTLESYRYIWILDPIDGTLAFANGMPFYGISLGVLKDLKPWLGGVYFPAVRELFWSDCDQTHFIEQAFSSQEKSRQILSLPEKDINRQTFFFTTESFFRKFQWDHSLCLLMSVPCAVLNLCWPAIGRGVGCLFDASLWDFAGSWPIVQAAGLKMHNLATGQPLEKIHTDCFLGTELKTWRVKGTYLVASGQNFPIIAKNLQIR